MRRWAAGLVGVAMACAAGCAFPSWKSQTPAVSLRLDRPPPYDAPVAETASTAESAAVAYRLRPGDSIVVAVRTPAEQLYEMMVDENGMIKLPLIPDIRAAGMTGSELEREIKNAYISHRIYRDVTVNVLVPQRSYFVRGEVRAPGRYPLLGSLTLLQAIAAAGGYTDFANPRRIQILRGGNPLTLDARNPEQDIPIETGDVIVVPRSVF